MIDRSARNSMAEAARFYLAGFLTNFEFNDAIFDLKTDDPAIKAIRQQLWLIYDDLQEHKCKGKWKLSEEEREIVIRIIMFLKSEIEYRWPKVPACYTSLRPIVWLLTFGIGVKSLDQKFEFKDSNNVWPFRSSEEIQGAKDEPKYLASVT